MAMWLGSNALLDGPRAPLVPGTGPLLERGAVHWSAQCGAAVKPLPTAFTQRSLAMLLICQYIPI